MASAKTERIGIAAINADAYNAWKPSVKEQIEIQTLNSTGIRGISRTLDIAKLKKSPPK